MTSRVLSRSLALMLAALLMGVCVSVCAEQTTVYAAVEDAIVYDADGNNIATLPLNTALTLTGVKRGICRVTLNGYIAYMNKSELSLTPVAAEIPDTSRGVTAYVKNQNAKVYDEGKNVIATLGKNVAVTVTAKKGRICRIVSNGRIGYMYLSDLSGQKVQSDSAASVPEGSAMAPARGTAREMDWWDSDIQKIFARGVVAQITDVETGLSWRERRNGGTNHADCQPLTAADTAAMKKAYGGKWSWDRRAVFVTINGVNYAASINGMPHGEGSIKDNNFNGHHCIHFTNSRTHGSNKVCPLHQAAIRKALLASL